MNNRFYLFLALSCLVLSSSCKEEQTFVDQYEVTHTETTVSGCFSTIISQIVLNVTYGEDNSLVTVLDREVQLDSEGSFDEQEFRGQIWNDEIEIYVEEGGGSCSQIDIYEGFKIE